MVSPWHVTWMFVGFQNRAALGALDMARPLRIEYEGTFYHVTLRGNDRQAMFFRGIGVV